MNPKAACLAVLLLAACGGSEDGSLSAGAVQKSTGCKDGLHATIVGGDLFVAEEGPIGMTLLANSPLSQYLFWVLYDNVYGIPTITNRQDKFGAAQPFPPGTSAGASTQLQLQPPSPDDLNGQAIATTFPKGIPVELLLRNYDGGPVSESNTATTASIDKDISPDGWPTASVTYGANNTATVTFFAAQLGQFSVGLTNVCGSGTSSSI